MRTPLTAGGRQGRSQGCRRWPTLPRSLDRSTIGAVGLNDRVRDGNGCGPYALIASECLVLKGSDARFARSPRCGVGVRAATGVAGRTCRLEEGCRTVVRWKTAKDW